MIIIREKIMNICLISMEYPPETNWGGIASYTFNTAHGLANLGHAVDVLSLTVSHTNYDYYDGKVHVHRIMCKNALPFKKSLVRMYDVFKKINSSRFDIIEAPEWGAEAFLSSFFPTAPLITRLHAPFYLVNQLSGRSISLTSLFMNYFEKNQTMRSAGITSPTKVLQSEVSRKWRIANSKITVIPNGIDIQKIQREALHSNPIESEYIVFIGRLEARKGVDVLAKALPGVFQKYPRLKVVFIGKDCTHLGRTMSEFIVKTNAKFKENLIFTGFIDSERFSFIKNAKFIVLPSLWENFPYACLESMAMGKAVIASKNSGFEEIIIHNKSGFLFKTSDYKALEKQIIRCLDSEDELKIVQHNAQQVAVNFDISRISKILSNYYQNILNGLGK
jgi:glycosyltransferase involved in cell wall biosynthesis